LWHQPTPATSDFVGIYCADGHHWRRSHSASSLIGGHTPPAYVVVLFALCALCALFALFALVALFALLFFGVVVETSTS
jgi:hypothetical protein